MGIFGSEFCLEKLVEKLEAMFPHHRLICAVVSIYSSIYPTGKNQEMQGGQSKRWFKRRL
jgi:hypothetical protein